MTLKIELSEKAKAAMSAKIICRSGECGLSNFDAAITAALKAMVKEGTACLAYGQITSDNEGDYWTACDEWRTGDFPALIIRLGDKP